MAAKALTITEDDLERLLGAKPPVCQVSRFRRWRWALSLVLRISYDPFASGPCPNRAITQVRLRCPHMDNIGWLCATHAKILKRKPMIPVCREAHCDLEITFL